MRGVLRPQGQGVASTDSSSSGNDGDSTCNPSCASHSAAISLPDLPITCSNRGTRKARHRLSRSASHNLGCPTCHKTMMECVNDGISALDSALNCSKVPATAEGANSPASAHQPCGKTRSRRFARVFSGNQGTRTAVRGAGWTGYTNESRRPLRNKTPVTTNSSNQALIILRRFSLKMARASARLTPNS